MPNVNLAGLSHHAEELLKMFHGIEAFEYGVGDETLFNLLGTAAAYANDLARQAYIVQSIYSEEEEEE